MKSIKKLLSIILILLVVLSICGNVNAAGGSMRAGKSSITVGQTVSITVSFGTKVNSAQFKLDYDTSKFDYVSCSERTYNSGTKRYTYLGMDTEPDLSSVTFTFKAKQTGSGTFSLSGGKFQSSSGQIAMSNLSTTVNVTAAQSTNNSGSSSKKPTTQKKTTNKKNTSNNNQDNSNNENTEPVVIQKTELTEIKKVVANLVETDYTEESWKALQEAIANAEAAGSEEDYAALKEKLSKDILQVAPFEKTELNKVLRALIGLPKENYTKESWDALQTAIVTADNAEIKSEYDKVKDKLNINGLVLDEKDFIEQLMDDSCGHKVIILTLASSVVILIITVICLGIAYERAKNTENMGRRIKE